MLINIFLFLIKSVLSFSIFQSYFIEINLKFVHLSK